MDETNPNGSGPNPMLMRPAEAAARTGLSVHFLKKKASAGVIPCTRGGKGAILFSQADLDEALQLLRQPPTETKSKRLTTGRAKKRAA